VKEIITFNGKVNVAVKLNVFIGEVSSSNTGRATGYSEIFLVFLSPFREIYV
jgi:hypothetical protein